METLLSKARATPRRPNTPPNAEAAALAVAWLTEEINFSQAAAASSRSGSAMYAQLARGIKDALRLGIIEVTRQRPKKGRAA